MPLHPPAKTTNTTELFYVTSHTPLTQNHRRTTAQKPLCTQSPSQSQRQRPSISRPEMLSITSDFPALSTPTSHPHPRRPQSAVPVRRVLPCGRRRCSCGTHMCATPDSRRRAPACNVPSTTLASQSHTSRTPCHATRATCRRRVQFNSMGAFDSMMPVLALPRGQREPVHAYVRAYALISHSLRAAARTSIPSAGWSEMAAPDTPLPNNKNSALGYR